MSTEKDLSQMINIHTNILKFPNKKENEQLLQQKTENEKLIQTIAMKMEQKNFDQLPLIDVEIEMLSNHGETIEFPPTIAARLISVLATQIKRNKYIEEDFL
jgi:hypothetical protein